MNATQQKERHTVLEDLQSSLDSFATGTEDKFAMLEKSIESAKQEAREACAREAKARLDLAQQQRSYVDSEDRILRLTQRRFFGMTFWNRCKWFLGMRWDFNNKILE